MSAFQTPMMLVLSLMTTFFFVLNCVLKFSNVVYEYRYFMYIWQGQRGRLFFVYMEAVILGMFYLFIYFSANCSVIPAA